MNPLWARKYQEARVEGFLCMRILQPMGLRGVALKLKGPFKCSHTDVRGVDGGLAEEVERELGLRENFFL